LVGTLLGPEASGAGVTGGWVSVVALLCLVPALCVGLGVGGVVV